MHHRCTTQLTTYDMIFRKHGGWWGGRYNTLHDRSLVTVSEGPRRHSGWTAASWSDCLESKTTYIGSDGSVLSAVDAVEVTVAQQDEFFWTSVISQHVKRGQGRQALEVFRKMQMLGVKPTSYTLVAALKACTSLRDLASVKELHADVAENGFQSHVYVGTMLVDAYAKCGSLPDARCVFEKMLHRTVVAWNAMILGYAQRGECGIALDLYRQMQREGVLPNERTFAAILKACSRWVPLEKENEEDLEDVTKRCLMLVRAIHSDVMRRGCEGNVFVGNLLIDVYARCGSLVDAKQVFEKLPERNVVSWTTMIWAYTLVEQGEVALELYAVMQQEEVEVDDRAFILVLKACSSLVGTVEGKNGDGAVMKKQRILDRVRLIHSDIVKARFDSDVFVGTTLIDAYGKCGSLVDARNVFEALPHRNAVCWSAMILAYAQSGEGQVALELFSRMQQEGVVPNERTFLCALKACSSMAAPQSEDGGGSMTGWCLGQVRSIHSQLVRYGFETDVFVKNMLVDVYAKCGSLTTARYIFENMSSRTAVSWNAIILGYAQADEGEVALQLYARMQEDGGVRANCRTFVAALKACSSLLTTTSGRGRVAGRVYSREQCVEQVGAIHMKALRAGCQSDLFLGNMLVDVYARCGSLEDARTVFEAMPHRDSISWTSMILAYAQADQASTALLLYRQMQQEGLLPNERTFVCALKACGSVAGLEMGVAIHAEVSALGLDATNLFVCNSLIDMYGKCGSMVDAQRVFDSLPVKDMVTWSALLAGYARHGESQVVFDVFRRMREEEGMQPDGITFLSLLTACSHAGLVDKGQECFSSMSSRYGVTPALEHYTCLVDLLGRAGHVDHAMDVVRNMPVQPDGTLWKSVLGACVKWGKVEHGMQAFDSAIKLDIKDSAAYVLMANVYTRVHRWEDARAVRASRVKSQAWKLPGESWWTDSDGFVHVFMAGDREHPDISHIHVKLRRLFAEMKKKHGYVPRLDSVLRNLSDGEKEESLCEHSEKLAIAYALLKTPKGTTIRVVKNLRICADCHMAALLISRIEQRTIVCRDANRFHVFKDGTCSCGDYW